jgi:hypothetical protein
VQVDRTKPILGRRVLTPTIREDPALLMARGFCRNAYRAYAVGYEKRVIVALRVMRDVISGFCSTVGFYDVLVRNICLAEMCRSNTLKTYGGPESDDSLSAQRISILERSVGHYDIMFVGHYTKGLFGCYRKKPSWGIFKSLKIHTNITS